MKRKVIVALLAVVMIASVAACGKTRPNASELTSGRSVVIDEGENTEKTEETDKESEDKETEEKETEEKETEEKETEEKETEEKETEEKDDDKSKPAAKGVVFGSDEAKGYDGFEYLMEELISTSETKSGNKASFSAFIPKDDYPNVSGSRARSKRMGVTFEIDLKPYLGYKSEDYTVNENLEKYMKSQFSSSTYKYSVEIGDVDEIDDDTATCLVTYMDYNSYEDTYSPIYELYKLEDIGDGITALYTVSIDSDETTGKTNTLLNELSSFYQIDIEWDDSFAETKRTAFENSDEYNADAFNLVFMSFELPEGWEKDEKNSSYSDIIFAPGGNVHKAYGYIEISKEFTSDDYVEALLDDPDYTAKALQSSMGDSVSDITIEAVKDTFMGEVAKVEMKVYDEEIDGTGSGIVYYGYQDYTLYVIAAFISDEAADNEAEDIRNAIDMLFETGKMKD